MAMVVVQQITDPQLEVPHPQEQRETATAARTQVTMIGFITKREVEVLRREQPQEDQVARNHSL